MQQHRAHPTRPAAVVLFALLAVLTFLLPVSAKSASRLSSTGTAATASAQTSATADAQRPVTVAHPVLTHAVPYPIHGFLGPGAGEAAPHRAVGGPAVAVTAAAAGASRGGNVCRPRGPPSRWSTEVRIDA
ncbi:hypothetical protein [Streptomyces viridochromogenes]|uniref:Uncharacterized protein n=1 Tax=Streptomyces viridochromogenes Tue57 TaxID=1160705 RepID=L8PFV7_STRVR|nr:hypothetical protein [Streptomyces viridochromogenes]ELS54958.1 hypothetical protein STVIR_4139 [Streptomyces viridochromogenes Tue57]